MGRTGDRPHQVSGFISRGNPFGGSFGADMRTYEAKGVRVARVGAIFDFPGLCESPGSLHYLWEDN